MRSIFFLLCGLLPLPAMAQMPVLKIKDRDGAGKVMMEDLKVRVNITGNVASTSMTMTFRNNSRRILEGELTFPMPEGVTVSRYALDINGKMREAVPVEKAKATEVFESIEHRNIDPGLLEKVQGNNFRTRIYPLPIGGTRTVTIGYEEELKYRNGKALEYHLPMDYKNMIANFSLNVSVYGASEEPILDESPDGSFSFRSNGKTYTASMDRKDFISRKSLKIYLPKTDEPSEILLENNTDGSAYFLLNDYPISRSKNKVWGNHIGLLWDVSLSGLQRDTKKEMELLGLIIGQKQNLTIELALLNNKLKNAGTYVIEAGNWDALRKKLSSLIYDGATDFSQARLPDFMQSMSVQGLDEILFFSEGLSTFGPYNINLKCPIHTINSAVKADFSTLKLISEASGGHFVNLSNQSANEAFAMLGKENLQFLGVERNDMISEVYPANATEVNGHVSVAGLIDEGVTRITLLYGYNGKITLRRNILVPASQTGDSTMVQKIWAQKKIAALDVRYDQHKKEIAALAQQFGIVTRNTSLMVLEDVDDYVRYNIDPPAELRAEYQRLMKTRQVQLEQRKTDLLQDAYIMMAELKKWWNTDFVAKKLTNLKKSFPTPAGQSDTVYVENLETGDVQMRVVRTESLQQTPPETRNSAQQNLLDIASTSPNVQQTRNGSALRIGGARLDNTQYVVDGVAISGDSSSGTRRHGIGDGTGVSGGGTESTQSNAQRLQAFSSGIPANLGDATGAVSQRRRGEEGPANAPPPFPNLRREGQRNSARAAGYASANQWKARNEETTGGSLSDEAPKVVTPEFKNDKDYMKMLNGKTVQNAYQQYLSLRKDYLTTPTFYYDVAQWFFQKKYRDTGLMILSNIAEMDLENAELYKMMAYQLKQNSFYEKELWVAKKVQEWRPMDPQSVRDLALAYEDNGQYQKALDTLYSVLLKSYSREAAARDDGIEEVIVMELNHLITLHKSQLNLSRIDKKLIAKLPVDIRVVLNWNKTDTDIDLWVTAPNGEKCFYSAPTTSAGGRISNDFTQGFGPEQFLLRKAIPGKYKIQTNFFGETQLSISGPTTLMAEIYLYYADGRQTRKVITLQSGEKGKESDGITVGEFTF